MPSLVLAGLQAISRLTTRKHKQIKQECEEIITQILAQEQQFIQSQQQQQQQQTGGGGGVDIDKTEWPTPLNTLYLWRELDKVRPLLPIGLAGYQIYIAKNDKWYSRMDRTVR